MKKIENIATLKMKSEHNYTTTQYDTLYNILLITIIFLTIITTILTMSWTFQRKFLTIVSNSSSTVDIKSTVSSAIL